MTRIEEMVSLLEEAAAVMSRLATDAERAALAARIRLFLDTPREMGPFEISLGRAAERMAR